MKIIAIQVILLMLLADCSSTSPGSTDSSGSISAKDEVGTPQEEAYMLQQSIPLSLIIDLQNPENCRSTIWCINHS